MSVTVKTLGGNKRVVQITPHTTIKQVLNQVCKEEEINPEQYCLIFKGKLLDESMRLHYSELKKDCELEVTEFKPFVGSVVVNVEMKGMMFTGSFQPEDNLLHIVRELCPAEFLGDCNSVLIISHLKKDYMGTPRLQDTTLQKLGISSGNIIFRLTIKEPVGVAKSKESAIPRRNQPQGDSNTPQSSSNSINKQSSQSQGKQDEEPNYVNDRNAIVFAVPDSTGPVEDPKDDFFELTHDEAKKIYQELVRNRESMEDKPLLTQALRKQEEKEKLDRYLKMYRSSVIRIQFPDHFVLQGLFASTEKVRAIHDFVKEYLNDPSTNFCLYMTPPKKILDVEKRLVDVGCVPRAKLYFSSSATTGPHYLKPTVMEDATEYSVAAMAAAKIRKQSLEPTPDAGEGTSKEGNQSEPQRQSTLKTTTTEYRAPSTSGATNTSVKDTKIPKWFKRN